MREKYGLLFPHPDVVAVTPFVHELFYKYLGIKGLSVALRRTPQKIHDICDYFDEKQVAAALARLDSCLTAPPPASRAIMTPVWAPPRVLF